jgi:long-chain acyl-CoA synthetase
MSRHTLDVISLDSAGSLAGLFQERVRRTPSAIAYRYYDQKQSSWRTYSWSESAKHIRAIQAALAREELEPGDRVAISVKNCPNWIFFEQAALGLGLVVVPLYVNDHPENTAYVLQNARVKLLLIENQHSLNKMESIAPQLKGLIRLVCVEKCPEIPLYPHLISLDDWKLPDAEAPSTPDIDIDDLATLVYTSGTTGRPKGVMLSHRNILFNANAALKIFDIYREDTMLSFLPLSHMLERTVGYYIPVMCGLTVAFARSVPELAADLKSQKPTILVSVPRIYESFYNKIYSELERKSPFAKKLFNDTVELGWQRFQLGHGGGLRWAMLNNIVAKKIMAKLGGHLRLAICGGAPLPAEVAKTFIGLGLNLIQGYGLTETSPIISGNPANDNKPDSVGVPLPGIEVKVGAHDELLVRSPSNMMGYWNYDEATHAVIDPDGWLHTGDKVRIKNNHIYITGRLKDILVLSNGEKVPPADMEIAISLDPLFEQVLIIGEGKPFLAAIVVLDNEAWKKEASANGFDLEDENILKNKKVHRYILNRIEDRLKGFPGYSTVRAVTIQYEPWTVDDGTMTCTMKLKRPVIIDRNQENIRLMYKGYK